MSYMSMVRPTNRIVAAGTPPIITEARVEVATNMYAGRLVEKGTNEDDVIISSAVDGNFAGWLGYEDTAPAYRPATPGTIYNAGDNAAVLSGGGFVILTPATGTLASRGLYVKWATGGGVAPAAVADAAWRIGVTEDAASGGYVLVRSLI